MNVTMVAQPVVPPAPAPPRGRGANLVSKRFRGYYRRWNDSSVFQPCGDARYYEVVGRGEALGALREQYRFTSFYLGRPLFAAMQGNFVEDTVRAEPSPGQTSAPPKIVKRFFVTKLDSLRSRSESDCRGQRSGAR